MVQVYDRETRRIECEFEPNDQMINFLYTTVFGRCILQVVKLPIINQIISLYYKSRLSSWMIHPFIEKYNIDVRRDLCLNTSFNNFFTRRRNIDFAKEGLILEKNEIPAIAEAKLTVEKITPDLRVKIKGSTYTLDELLDWHCKKHLEKFRGGWCFIYRLSAFNYHHFHAIDNLLCQARHHVGSELHTVRPISDKYKVFSRNKRVVNLLHTSNFGDVIQVEVGALTIGHIVNYKKRYYQKLDDTGFFEYGGSTVVVLMDKNVTVAPDILMCSECNIECRVNVGDLVGMYKGEKKDA